jgi:hypothetical protein
MMVNAGARSQTTGTFIQKIYAPSSSLLQGKHLLFTPSPLPLNIFRLFVILSLTQLYRYTPEIFKSPKQRLETYCFCSVSYNYYYYFYFYYSYSSPSPFFPQTMNLSTADLMTEPPQN